MKNRRQKKVCAAGAVREGRAEEEVGEKVLGEGAMDDNDSGGFSADKAPGAEDEGSTAPLPEKVVLISRFSHYFCILFSLFSE